MYFNIIRKNQIIFRTGINGIYKIKHILSFIIFYLFSIIAIDSQSITEQIKLGGFIDTYYAYDLEKPASQDRGYTTSAARNNTFNVNLLFLDASLSSEKIRGRGAIQYGTSVTANYLGESTTSKIANQFSVRNMQEGYVGFKLAPKLWLDAGIYFSHIGFGNFISWDNWTYTRSMIADFSPYQQAGTRLSYELSSKINVQLHVMNGWGNLVETNTDKAAGTLIEYNVLDNLKITYSNFAGNEQPKGSPYLIRYFNNIILYYDLTSHFQFALSMDAGHQKKPDSNKAFQQWYGYTFLFKWKNTDRLYTTFRVERFLDSKQITVSTATPNGFQVTGGSINIDYHYDKSLLIRGEIKVHKSLDAIYEAEKGKHRFDRLAVISISMKI